MFISILYSVILEILFCVYTLINIEYSSYASASYSVTQSSSSHIPEGAVDLGLSVLWASCNLGASSPEEYGDYYAWGEVIPYYSDGHSQDDPCSSWQDRSDHQRIDGIPQKGKRQGGIRPDINLFVRKFLEYQSPQAFFHLTPSLVSSRMIPFCFSSSRIASALAKSRAFLAAFLSSILAST